MKKIFFLAVIAMCCSSLIAQDRQVNSDDLKQLEGNWRGTLEYFDAKKTKKDLVLKTELICEVKKGVLVMKFKYYDKNGEFTRRTERLVLIDNGASLQDNRVWEVINIVRNHDEADIKLALHADANEESNAMRKTISIKNGQLSIAKDELLGRGDKTNSLYSFNFQKLEHDLYR